MSRDIHRIIINEYESRQQAASYRQLLKREEVYKKIPRIEEIDNEIRLAGVKYNKAILLGIEPSDKAIKELLAKIERLNQEKKELLIKHSYPEDYLEPEFQCKQCKDTGFVETPTGTEKCSCYRQQYINHLFKQSNIKVLDVENFSTFNVNFYPDEIDEKKYGIKISPRQNILKIRERALAFIENIDNPQDKNLFFSGPTGVGKTFMINCIASELLKRGRTVLYQTAQSLFKVINDYRLSALKDGEFEDTAYSDIFNVELLIIDDLGPNLQRQQDMQNF